MTTHENALPPPDWTPPVDGSPEVDPCKCGAEVALLVLAEFRKLAERVQDAERRLDALEPECKGIHPGMAGACACGATWNLL